DTRAAFAMSASGTSTPPRFTISRSAASQIRCRVAGSPPFGLDILSSLGLRCVRVLDMVSSVARTTPVVAQTRPWRRWDDALYDSPVVLLGYGVANLRRWPVRKLRRASRMEPKAARIVCRIPRINRQSDEHCGVLGACDAALRAERARRPRGGPLGRESGRALD